MERHIQWGGTAQASSGKWEIKGVYLLYEETANASCVARDQREEVWGKTGRGQLLTDPNRRLESPRWQDEVVVLFRFVLFEG